eukprot:11177244-Lingulodinium_polyedra.AAC.1
MRACAEQLTEESHALQPDAAPRVYGAVSGNWELEVAELRLQLWLQCCRLSHSRQLEALGDAEVVVGAMRAQAPCGLGLLMPLLHVFPRCFCGFFSPVCSRSSSPPAGRLECDDSVAQESYPVHV